MRIRLGRSYGVNRRCKLTFTMGVRTLAVIMVVFEMVVGGGLGGPADAYGAALREGSAASRIPRYAPVIQVRQTVGGGQFYNVRSGRRFIPRGSNYIRLSSVTQYHDTFDVGKYNQQEAKAALSKMRRLGYNTVRVWINWTRLPGGVGSASGGLSQAYLANFTNFLKMAWKDKIFTIPVLSKLPQQGGYFPPTLPADMGSVNAFYLDGQYVQAKARYARDFVKDLIGLHAPLADILGYELQNEQNYENNEAPLNMTSGLVTTGNGGTYNMASQTSKNQMMDDNLLYWFDTVAAAIRSVEPHALVTVSFFAPYYREVTDPSDTRIVRPQIIINDSTASFLDLHLYPAWGGTVQQQLDTFGVTNLAKPLIMGEFGSTKSDQTTVQEAAQVLQSWETASCFTTHGYFQGWLVWTWDGALTGNGTDLQGSVWWNMADANYTIADALAPKYHPDPCSFSTR